jgi:hypothetical protein
MAFVRCNSTVVTYHSTMPSSCGCRGVICMLQSPRHCNTCRICDYVVTFVAVQSPQDPKLIEVGHKNAHHHHWLFIRSVINLRLLGELVLCNREVLSPLLLTEKGPAPSVVILSNSAQMLYCLIRPQVQGLGLLCRCHIFGTTSHHLHVASSTYIGPCPGLS